MKVLIAEDDPHTRSGLVEILQDEGYEVIAVADGTAALAAFEREKPDFVCLDIMMPGKDGYQVCRRLRELSATTPIMFISAKGEEIDRVLGLELGADDFIVKPFGVREVVARVRAVTRRCYALHGSQVAPPVAAIDPDAPFRLDDLEVLPRELRARRGTVSIDLSLRDVAMLRLFFQNPGQVLDRQRIFTVCWGEDHFASSRTLDQHISQLRKRIEQDPQNPRIIQTVHKAGYRYEGPK
jgi:DNA-binding response OmpR family regulator